MLCKVIHRNTRPHQLRWGDWEMGTAILWSECSQTTRLIQKVARDSSKALTLCAAVLLQLSFIGMYLLMLSHRAVMHEQ